MRAPVRLFAFDWPTVGLLLIALVLVGLVFWWLLWSD
jgi:hypothetical protein